MHLKEQTNAFTALENVSQQASIALRSRREMTLEERKNVCKGLEYAGIVTDTIGNVATDVGDISAETLKPITFCIALVSRIFTFGIKIASAALECDDVPFDELKQILDERFNELGRKLDANTEALEQLSKEVSKVFVKIEQTRNEMKEGFNEVLDQLESQEIKAIVNDLNTFIKYFEKERKEMKSLPQDQYIGKLLKTNGILDYLRNARLPSEDSLYSILFRLIDKNNKFTIPKSIDDTKAFQALYALFYGTQTYASIMFFLLEHHSYLAGFYYQNAELDKFNEEFVTVKNIFDEFLSSLVGEDENKPLLKQVIGILEEVKNLKFIDKVENKLYQDLLKQEESLLTLKRKIEKFELPIIYDVPEKAVNIDFVDPVLIAPYGKWQKGSTVTYAIQLVKDGKYSKLSEWSKPFTVQEQANPTLTFSVDDKRRDRLIFRKIDDAMPELIGILKFPEVEFKDINRDLYNVVLNVNKQKSLKEFKKLIRIKADMNAVFELRRTVLHAAAESGNDIVANYIISKGFNVNIEDEKGFTPLHVASEVNRYNITELLIEKGADVNIRTKVDLLTPLHIASKRGFLDTVNKLLSSKSIHINEKDQSGLTALHQAVFGGANIVRALTQINGIDLNAKSNVGLTPFHLAAINGDKEVSDALLESGKVDINAGNINGLTALHFTSMVENLEVMKYLLSLEGIDVNAKSNDIKWTPLHLAIYSKQEKTASELMKNSKIDINALAKGKITPLHLSVATGQLLMSTELLNRNADIEAKTEEGYTPLHLSVMHLDADMQTMLLEKGANIEGKSNDGSTALHLAIKTNKLETVKKLLDKNANLNAQMTDGSTPLHLAVSLKQNDIVSHLLSKGVDINIYDGKNLLAVYIGIQNADLDVLRLFIQFHPKLLQNESEKHVKFIYKSFIQDTYDYLKNADTEKYEQYKGLKPYDVLVKQGKYEILKILLNDPKAEEPVDLFPDTKINAIQFSLASVITIAQECINSEVNNAPKEDLCPSPSRLRRNLEKVKKVNKDSLTLSDTTSNDAYATPYNLTDKSAPLPLSFADNTNSFSYFPYGSILNIDGVGFLLLMNLLIRKFTDESFVKNKSKDYSDLELQARALTITENIEKLLAVVNESSPTEELVDFAEIHSKVYKALKTGDESGIVKYICPAIKSFFDSKLIEAIHADYYSREDLQLAFKKLCLNDDQNNSKLFLK